MDLTVRYVVLNIRFFFIFLQLLFGCCLQIRADDLLDSEEPPEGYIFNEPPIGMTNFTLKHFYSCRYYAFIESPSAVPPKVRSPPYTHINIDCKDATNAKPYVSANNLCGDLNKGKIPRNPMRQSVLGEPYPL